MSVEEYHHNIHLSETPNEKQALRKTIIEKFMTKHRVSDKMIHGAPDVQVIQPTTSENVFAFVRDDEARGRDRKFRYLEGDPLAMAETDVDVSKPLKLFLFLYRIQENFEEPFLEVCFVKREKAYTLPGRDVVIATETDGQEDGEERPIFDQAALLFEELTGETHDDAVGKYRGFVETEDEYRNKCIISVFGSVEGDIEVSGGGDGVDPIWAIVDEVWYKTRILDIPVKEFLVKTFNEHPSLMCIRDQDGVATNPPYLMYLCENDNNVFYTKPEGVEGVEGSEGSEDGWRTLDVLNVRKNHALFGSTYMFSTEPFEYNNLSNIKRYAVMVKDPLYLLNYDFPVTEFKNVDASRVVSFYEGGKEMWSVKNENLFVEL